MSLQTRTWVSTIFRFVLAGVWLYAGGIKLTQPHGAREAVIAYRIFPASWVDFLGWALPALEVGLGRSELPVAPDCLGGQRGGFRKCGE